MDREAAKKALQSEKASGFFKEMYGTGAAENETRYEHVLEEFGQAFGEKNVSMFTSAGRTEISGNHTDHNNGKVLAGSINLDCVACAAANGTDEIHIISETYSQKFTININNLKPSDKMAGTIDLTKGMLAGFQEMGYQIGGFDAYITSNVISSAGVSSSASYEMLICSMINEFFNDGKVDVVTYAHVGKYAENKYWNKGSGLLDQMACAVGGMITIDFKNPLKPVVEKIDYDFGAQDHSLIIVQTGKGHADLSEEYSSIPNEMKRVAAVFGKEFCADITEKEVIVTAFPHCFYKKISQSSSTFLQFFRTSCITAFGSCPSSNSTIIFRVMKFTVASLTPAVFLAASSILFAQFAQSTSIL